MSDDIKTIDEFDLGLIFEYYASVERQGPGSPEVTQKALSFVEGLTDESRIADIGCGTGGQTMVLAQHAPGQITGLDLSELFIDLFNENVSKLGLQDRVKGSVASMDNLSFAEEELDLIWSEGAIYNIGFENGLKEWRKFLKPNGYIAVSEICWFTHSRPDEVNDFWCSEYPEMDTIPNKVAQMQNAGYVPVASFVLPETCWEDHYYAPQEKVMADFLQKYKGNETVEGFIAMQKHEAELYRKYKAFYGYVFYIGKRI